MEELDRHRDRRATRPRTPKQRPADEKEKFALVLDAAFIQFKAHLVQEFDNYFVGGNGNIRGTTSYARPVSPVLPVALARQGSSFEFVSESVISHNGEANGYASHTGEGNGYARSFRASVMPENRLTTCSEVAHICADQDDFEPTLDDTVTAPLDRWARLYQLILAPKSLAKYTKVYHMHECWSAYFRMLVHNEGNCQAEFKIALKKISSQRRDFRSYSGTSQFTYVEEALPWYVVIAPDSKFRLLWTCLALMVICCDTFFLPLQASFDSDEEGHFSVLWCTTATFWGLDIIINILSDRYKRELVDSRSRCCDRGCLRSRIIFDIVLVLIDWNLHLISGVMKSQSLNTFGLTFRSLRIMCLIRLCRLVRLQMLLRDVFATSGKSIIAFSAVLKASLAYSIYVHLLACVWYSVGRADGWSAECGSNSMPTIYCYATALHWSLTQIHGTTTLEHNTTTESIFAVFAVFVGLLQFAVLLGKIVDATAQIMGVDKLELRQRCANLAKRHSLSKKIKLKIMHFVDANDIELHLDRVFQQDRDLLAILPVSLQTETLEEMRRPLLAISIFADLGSVSSKILTQLCSEAVVSTIIVASEVVFSVGDQGRFWRIVDTGTLQYWKKDEDMWSKVFGFLRDSKAVHAARKSVVKQEKQQMLQRLDSSHEVGRVTSNDESRHSLVSSPFAKILTRQSTISEMVLWTPWVHTGDFLALSDSMLLQLAMETFHHVVKARVDTCLLAARYAQQYVKQLTQVGNSISDMFQYVDHGEDYDYADYSLEDSTEHLIFLSHYKEEAGTEATLMQVGLQAAIANHGNEWDVTGIFLDSENLTDLSGLQEHVVKSKNLVLLLTPGVLQRPWCLVEILTAKINEVQIVPVEIQRPGMTFVYPDEEFYSRLRKGGILTKKDVKLLSVEGIAVEDVEDALRSVFTQIALPFSPHKSKNVRDAELSDIVRRCAPNKGRMGETGSMRPYKSKKSNNDATSLL